MDDKHHADGPHAALTGNATVERLTDACGQVYFKATCPIESIFGMDVYGSLMAIGRTKEQALERLRKEQEKLNDSLWY